uniref:transporter substrate-binding domain-containing protein n=1 Tax=Streptomyces sp. SBT349 TaxID=1580539 RepID=UPI00066E42BC
GGDSGDGSGGGDLTIGVRYDQPGLGLRSDEAVHTGFDIDVATYIAGELGVAAEDIDWTEAPAADRETLLARGEVDFVVATYQITDAREAEVDFAGPYFAARQDLLIREHEEIADAGALDGRKLCSVPGSTAAETVRQQFAPGVVIMELATYPECLTALSDGAVDAVTTDDCILAGYAAQDEYRGRFRLAGLEMGREYLYGVGVPEGETALRDDIDLAIGRMIADGSWAAAVEENFGGVEDYDPQPPPEAATTG